MLEERVRSESSFVTHLLSLLSMELTVSSSLIPLKNVWLLGLRHCVVPSRTTVGGTLGSPIGGLASASSSSSDDDLESSLSR